MRFEKKHEHLLPVNQFIYRQLIYAAVAMSIFIFSLVLGVLGYKFFEGLPWIDSLLNASMILGGMGEVDVLKTYNGKLFASLYALYSGLIVVAASGILIAPAFHRIIHLFHISDEKDQDDN